MWRLVARPIRILYVLQFRQLKFWFYCYSSVDCGTVSGWSNRKTVTCSQGCVPTLTAQ